jgi:hypothetical protein
LSSKGIKQRPHNEKLNILYFSPNIILAIKSKRKRWAGHVARVGSGTCRVLLGKPKGKRSLGIPRRRWEDDIKMDFRKGDVAGTGLICLTTGTYSGRL